MGINIKEIIKKRVYYIIYQDSLNFESHYKIGRFSK
jgi:hypothetical protein